MRASLSIFFWFRRRPKKSKKRKPKKSKKKKKKRKKKKKKTKKDVKKIGDPIHQKKVKEVKKEKKKQKEKMGSKRKMTFGVIDVVVLVVILYAFIVAVYNTFVSDCSLGGSDNFGRKFVTWLVAWPIMLLCRTSGSSGSAGPSPGQSVSTAPMAPGLTTSFSYSTEI
jgi:cation transport ATPase